MKDPVFCKMNLFVVLLLLITDLVNGKCDIRRWYGCKKIKPPDPQNGPRM